MATVTVRYSDCPERRGVWTPTPEGVIGLNDEQIAALGTAGAGELGARMQQDLAALRAQVEGYGDQMPSIATYTSGRWRTLTPRRDTRRHTTEACGVGFGTKRPASASTTALAPTSDIWTTETATSAKDRHAT